MVNAFFVFRECKMPYITEEDRQGLDNDIDRLAEILYTRGEHNYAITRLKHHWEVYK